MAITHTTFELFDTCRLIKQAVADDGDLGEVVFGDVTKLNENPDRQYPVVVVTQREHLMYEDYMQLNFSLIYVQPTNEEATDTYIQSMAIAKLKSLINTLNIADYPLKFTTFTGRFADLCAGAWVDVSFTVPLYSYTVCNS